MTMHLRTDPSTCPGRRPAWTLWMCSLFWGCIVSSVWSSSNVASSASSSSSVSQAQYEHHFHGSKHHSVPISIYRSPVSLRGGHGGCPSCFFLTFPRSSRSGGGGAGSAPRTMPAAPRDGRGSPSPPTLPGPLSRAGCRGRAASRASRPCWVLPAGREGGRWGRVGSPWAGGSGGRRGPGGPGRNHGGRGALLGIWGRRPP